MVRINPESFGRLEPGEYLMKSSTLLASLLALAAAPAMAADPAPAAAPACAPGHMGIIRTSQIKPSGSFAGFGKAVADHAKWYTDHGYTGDKFSWGRVWTYDQAKKMPVALPDKAMTFHFNDTNVPDSAKSDAGWAAFVAEYSANSTIVSTTFVCTE